MTQTQEEDGGFLSHYRPEDESNRALELAHDTVRQVLEILPRLAVLVSSVEDLLHLVRVTHLDLEDLHRLHRDLEGVTADCTSTQLTLSGRARAVAARDAREHRASRE